VRKKQGNVERERGEDATISVPGGEVKATQNGDRISPVLEKKGKTRKVQRVKRGGNTRTQRKKISGKREGKGTELQKGDGQGGQTSCGKGSRGWTSPWKNHGSISGKKASKVHIEGNGGGAVSVVLGASAGRGIIGEGKKKGCEIPT